MPVTDTAPPGASPEGALALELRVEQGRVAEVTVRSTRRTDLSAALKGRPVAEALTLVRSLFSICATAHQVAALEACEAALGVRAPEEARQARQLLCALEALDNHAFSLCVEWPTVLARPAVVEALRRLRAATGAVRRWCAPQPGWAALGGDLGRARAPVRELLGALRLAVLPLAPDAALADEPTLRRWAGADQGPAAQLLREVFDAGAERFGLATAPLLPALAPGWFAQRLTSAEFAARPTLDGTPAESGAVARAAAHPAVAAHLRQGRSILPRLVARLADLRERLDEVTGRAQNLQPARAAEGAARASGRGAGVADTARGRLAHVVELESGQVVGWRTVAPTEWSFHPTGVLREALLGAPALDLQRRARWLVTALDPCVECAVLVRGEG